MSICFCVLACLLEAFNSSTIHQIQNKLGLRIDQGNGNKLTKAEGQWVKGQVYISDSPKTFFFIWIKFMYNSYHSSFDQDETLVWKILFFPPITHTGMLAALTIFQEKLSRKPHWNPSSTKKDYVLKFQSYVAFCNPCLLVHVSIILLTIKFEILLENLSWSQSIVVGLFIQGLTSLF